MKFLSLMIPKEAVESGWLDITSAEERTNRTLLTQRIDGNHRILKWMLAHSRPQSIRTTMNYLFEGRAISGIFELGDSALPSSVWSNWQGGILCFPMDEVTACMMNLLYDWIIICTSFVQCWVMCGLLCDVVYFLLSFPLFFSCERNAASSRLGGDCWCLDFFLNFLDCRDNQLVWKRWDRLRVHPIPASSQLLIHLVQQWFKTRLSLGQNRNKKHLLNLLMLRYSSSSLQPVS